MYLVEDLVDLGLDENQHWPSDGHRKVAKTLCICNPNVRTREMLTKVIQAVISVPQEQIYTITYKKLVEDFDCPNVGIYQ